MSHAIPGEDISSNFRAACVHILDGKSNDNGKRKEELFFYFVCGRKKLMVKDVTFIQRKSCVYDDELKWLI